jgi:lantibiotic modifying enzyme
MVGSRPSRALCLCHGALGRLEFLSFADQRLWRDDQREQLEAWRRSLLGEIIRGRWVADVAHSLENPGLMLGLAGTGYSLLRQVPGSRIASALMLEEVLQ